MSYININKLTFSYGGSAEEIFHNVSLQIDGKWKLGLIGRNGRGKTTFLNLLLGKYKHEGTINSDMSFVYFPYEVLDKSKMTLEIMQETCADAEDWQFIREVSLLGVEAECLYRSFDSLSNGEQTKILLAALFIGENRFLLLDEPTNHVDADGRKKSVNICKRKMGIYWFHMTAYCWTTVSITCFPSTEQISKFSKVIFHRGGTTSNELNNMNLQKMRNCGKI